MTTATQPQSVPGRNVQTILLTIITAAVCAIAFVQVDSYLAASKATARVKQSADVARIMRDTCATLQAKGKTAAFCD